MPRYLTLCIEKKACKKTVNKLNGWFKDAEWHKLMCIQLQVSQEALKPFEIAAYEL